MFDNFLQKNGYQIILNFLNKPSLECLAFHASIFSMEPTTIRKNVFSKSQEVHTIFKQLEQKLNEQGLSCSMTNYCFYLEKTTDKNWPLQIHQDINLPTYLNLTLSEQEYWLQHGFWLRINLDANNKHTGALKVIPQSHLLGQNASIEKNKSIFLPVEKGDAILFSPLTYHGSDKMKYAWTRRIFQCFFLPTKPVT